MPAGYRSGHVRTLALSPGGDRLLAPNTPDNRLAIYTIGSGGLSLAAEVPVGLEPVAVAARTDLAGRTEAWVMNHLSDSVSVVEIDPADAKVGTFGVPPGTQAPATGFLGDQVRGFGFLHDGSIDSVFDFLHANGFAFGSNADTKRRQVEAFLMTTPGSCRSWASRYRPPRPPSPPRR